MIIFDHIPKTGGTTLYEYIRRSFPRSDYLIIDDNDRDAEHQRFLNMSDHERRRFRIVAGHQMEFARDAEPDATYFSLVRDPVQRDISAYLHVLYHPGMQPYRDKAEPLPTLTEFVQSDKLMHRNLQSLILLGSIDESLTDEAIRQVLAKRYAIIGILEEYNQFLFYLHRRLGFPLQLFNMHNVRRERSTFKVAPADIMNIRENNTADLRTYEIARRLFESQFMASMTYSDWGCLLLFEKCVDCFRVLTNGDTTKSFCIATAQVSFADLKAYHDLLQALLMRETSKMEAVCVPVATLSRVSGQLDFRHQAAIIATEPQAWMFSAVIRDLTLKMSPIKPSAIRLIVTVARGTLDVGWFDGTKFEAEVLIDNASGDSAVYLFIPKGTNGSTLVFRNASASGGTVAAIRSIEIY